MLSDDLNTLDQAISHPRISKARRDDVYGAYGRLSDALARLATLERVEPQRRRALSILHQIYDLGIDPKNAHLAASAHTLLTNAEKQP